MLNKMVREVLKTPSFQHCL